MMLKGRGTKGVESKEKECCVNVMLKGLGRAWEVKRSAILVLLSDAEGTGEGRRGK